MLLVPRLLGWLGPGDPLVILLLDRHALVIAALSTVLRDAFARVEIETALSSDTALQTIASRRVDLFFCELRSRPLPGPEVVQRVAEISPGTRVILLADAEDAPLLVAQLSCGAAAFLTKDASPGDFLEAVDAVLQGNFVVGRNLVRTSLTRLSNPAAKRQSGVDLLSPAERTVLTLLAQGRSIREIAAQRTISEKTVRNHLSRIYRKLEFRNRSEAISWSARVGLVDTTAKLT